MFEKQDEDKKVTNEKPVSLFPLDFKEALAAFLKVKPKSKKGMDKAIRAKEKKNKKKPSG
jgi:hypothetical protein